MISLFLSLLLTTSDAGVFARPVQVSADRLEIFKKDSRALYSGHAKAVRDRRDATAKADRLAARVAEIESELARLRDEADDAAEAVDATADKEARVAERMADAETALADALTALDRL